MPETVRARRIGRLEGGELQVGEQHHRRRHGQAQRELADRLHRAELGQDTKLERKPLPRGWCAAIPSGLSSPARFFGGTDI
jgi:hypothetical protein